ncbi:hypothetical protein OESDEN_24198, partial [Oesophagostomum dentatum]
MDPLEEAIALLSRERIACSHQVNFYHVPTCENVADYATRGLTHEDARNSVWFGGPEWLNHDHSTWPVRPVDHLSQEEKEECFAILAATQETHHTNSKKGRIWPTEKVSNYDKLRRIVAYSLRFIRNASKTRIAALELPCVSFDSSPNAQEMMQAEQYLLREEQQQADLQSLMKSCENIRLDSNGLVRKFGRMQNSELSFDAANPIYLPRKGLLNQRIAAELHRSLCHCGTNQLVQALRQKFWMPADKSMCKRIIRNCSICQRHNAVPFKYPHMGPLPAERVTQSPPFSFTGVDLMGPLTIKNIMDEDEKRYVALFTCLVTRM